LTAQAGAVRPWRRCVLRSQDICTPRRTCRGGCPTATTAVDHLAPTRYPLHLSGERTGAAPPTRGSTGSDPGGRGISSKISDSGLAGRVSSKPHSVHFAFLPRYEMPLQSHRLFGLDGGKRIGHG